MGQKVNPIGLRVGVIKTWDSIWYADKKTYVKNLHEDLKIKDFIKSYPFPSVFAPRIVMRVLHPFVYDGTERKQLE